MTGSNQFQISSNGSMRFWPACAKKDRFSRIEPVPNGSNILARKIQRRPPTRIMGSPG
jgi:hypothetical protein